MYHLKRYCVFIGLVYLITAEIVLCTSANFTAEGFTTTATSDITAKTNITAAISNTSTATKKNQWVTVANENEITDQMRREQYKILNEVYGNVSAVEMRFSFTVEPEDVLFHLFTRKNRNNYTFTMTERRVLRRSTFNSKKKTKVLAHGWLQSGQDFIDEFKTAYLDKGDINLIFVDWGEYSKNEYEYTVLNIVPKVGEAVGMLLKCMLACGTSIDDIHLIGFSMGAHVMSYAAKYVKKKVSRITALDPAGVGFVGTLHSDRLTKDDANFVDVIHTNGLGIGIDQPVGHVDFYPNGGRSQPGCFFANLICFHLRSVTLYKESVLNEKTFHAIKCDSYEEYLENKCKENDEVIMGEHIETKRVKPGKFFLETNDDEPYSKGAHNRG